MLVKDVFKEFTYECEIRKLTPKTVKSYRSNIDASLVYLEKENSICELEDINHLHIKDYFNFEANTKFLKKYNSYGLLILDEWLLEDISEEEQHFIFELIERRHDQTSTIFCVEYKQIKM